MPKTIQNAMILVKELGLRYLWFDSLCLIQDDIDDLKNGIMNMDAVYESAWFTIIAAQGSTAATGLPGVSQFPRELKQEIIPVKPGMRFLHVRSLDHHLNRTVYASRGWT